MRGMRSRCGDGRGSSGEGGEVIGVAGSGIEVKKEMQANEQVIRYVGGVEYDTEISVIEDSSFER